MIDYHIESKFTRIVRLTGTEDNLTIFHDYGEFTIPWEDLLYAFAVKIKNPEGSETPIFVFFLKDQQGFYYIDGLKISPSYFNFEDSKVEDKFERSYLNPKTVDLTEKKFKWLASAICDHLKTAYIDRPIIECIKGSIFFLPTFHTLKDVAIYANDIISSAKRNVIKEVHVNEEDNDETKKISIPSTTREEWKVGMVIDGKYTIQEVIKGGMGIVYIAFDPGNAKFYAVKTFQERYLWNERVVKQFVKEAEIWINLERHPNIVKAELVKIIEGKPYIFLEYILGTDLDELLSEDLLPVKKSLEFAIQFCEGMSYAFKKLSLVHRDIKPSNCIITKDGVVKITDFGLGKIFDEIPAEGEVVKIPQQPRSKTRSRYKSRSGSQSQSSFSSTSMVGTLPFMAPELFSDVKAAGVKTDIYSFGVVLYMMLTGINPFYHEVQSELIMKHLTAEPSAPHDLNSDVPPELSEITLRCLKKNPKDRFDNFDEIKKELERVYEVNFGNSFVLPRTGDVFSEDDWINKGISLASINHHREAIVTFDQALKINNKSTKANTLKGKSLLQIGHLDEALSLLTEVILVDPLNWEAWFYKGEVEKLKNNPEEALSSFERALELEPTRAEIMGSMGILLEEMGRVENALFCFDYALEKNPKNEELWESKGKILLKQYRFEEASECFDKAIAINPRHQSAWSHRGEALYRLCFYTEAVNAYRTAITLNPELVKERLRIASCYIELGDFQRAMLTYDQALMIRSTDMEIYLAKASLLESMFLQEEALKCLKVAREIQPSNKKICLQMARLFLKTGEFEKALSVCNELSDAGENNWELNLLKESANFWIERKNNCISKFKELKPVENKDISKDLSTLLCVFCDIDDALEYLLKELTLREDAHKLFYVAVLYKIKGDRDKALEFSQKALGLKGELNEARNFIQQIIRESEGIKEKRKGILASFMKKETRSLRTPEDLMVMGIEKIFRGEFLDALGFLQESLEKNPDLCPSYFFAGVAFRRIGDLENARKFLNTFQSKVPDSPGFYKYEIENASSEIDTKREMFYKWITLSPYNPEPWLSFIKFLADCNDLENARIIAKEVIKKYANRWNISKKTAQFWSLRGILELFIGNTKKATRFFEKSLSYDQEDPIALLGSAKLFELKGNTTRAMKVYEKLALIDNCTIMATYQTACLYLKNEKKQEALKLLEMALEKKPDSYILCYKKACTFADSSDYAGFWNYFYTIYHLDTKFPPFFSLRTRAFVNTKRVNEALSYIRGALTSNPDNVILLDILGFLCLKMNMPQKAIENFDKIIAKGGCHSKCFLGKGIAFYMMGQYRDAIILFEKYLTFYPDDPDIHLLLGATQFHLNDHKRALFYFRKSIEMKKRFPKVWSNLGIFYCRREKYMFALRYADWSLRHDKDNFYAWLCKSKAQQELGRLEDAYKSIEKALFYSPQDLNGWIQRGIIEFKMRNYKKSLESFSKACEIDDKQAKLWHNRGAAALSAREYQEAEKCIDNALRINPALFLAWLAKAILAKIQNNKNEYIKAKSYAKALNPETFEDWYAQFSSCTGGLFEDIINVYEEIILSFDLPQYPAIESIEPIQPIHYPDMDQNF